MYITSPPVGLVDLRCSSSLWWCLSSGGPLLIVLKYCFPRGRIKSGMQRQTCLCVYMTEKITQNPISEPDDGSHRNVCGFWIVSSCSVASLTHTHSQKLRSPSSEKYWEIVWFDALANNLPANSSLTWTMELCLKLTQRDFMAFEI